MASKLNGVTFAVMIVYIVAARAQKPLLTVYYESKCPDSIRFIIQQLQPAMRQLGDEITLRLVPFGKAHSINEGHDGFECQHGPSECLGNMVQDCALYHMRNSSNADKASYVACEMETLAGTRGDLQCVEKANLPVDLVSDFLEDGQGVTIQLLSEYLTQQVKPAFIPTVTLNDVFDQQFQDQAMHDLVGALCSVSTGANCARYHNDVALRNLFQQT